MAAEKREREGKRDASECTGEREGEKERKHRKKEVPVFTALYCQVRT